MHFLDDFPDDLPRRTYLDDEERIAETDSAKNLTPPVILVNKGLRSNKLDTLVVSCSKIGCRVLQWLVQDLELVGSVLLPELSLAGNTLSGSLVDSTAFMRLNQNGNVLFIPCQYEVKPERALAWSTGLFQSLSPSRLVLIGDMKAGEYRGQGDPAEEALVFSCFTTSARDSSWTSQSLLKPLPPGNLLTGLPAALLQNCELKNIPAVGLIHVDFTSRPDALVSKKLVKSMDSLLNNHQDLKMFKTTFDSELHETGSTSLFT
eukprot:g8855.t1